LDVERLNERSFAWGVIEMPEGETKRTYDLEERLLQFSARIIRLVEDLPNTRTGNHVANQLLRSGTSP
jgi:hypothetical protein